MIPSACEFTFEVPGNLDDYVIPQYTAIDTGKVDAQGKKVYYSFA